MDKRNQRRRGVISSYIYIMVYSLTGILFTPFLISHLGDAEYGLYQIMASFAGYLVLMSFGTGTAMTRYVSLYIGKRDKKGESNFIAMCLIITGILVGLIATVATALYGQLDTIFSSSLTVTQLVKAEILYIILVINIIIVLISQAFEGIISAYEKFAILNFWRMIKVLLRVVLVVSLVLIGCDSVTIVLVDLFLSIVFLVFSIWYSLWSIKVKIKLYKFDKAIFKDVAIFSLAILFQSIVNQVNSNVDKTILGITIGPVSVTLYSVAMSIFSIFSSLSTVTIAIYLPQLTKMVADGADGEAITDAIIAPSRIQTIISGSILFGFLLCGRDFIMVWMRDSDYLDAWLIGVIIMIPMFLTYINGLVVSILDAMRKRLFRSVVLAFMALLNVVLSVFLVKKIGYMGAPIGTAIATILGQVIVMNIYYKKVIGLNVKKMYVEILRGILPSLIFATIVTVPFLYLLPLGFKGLIIKGGVFIVTLGLVLYFKGLNTYEKKMLMSMLNKIIYKEKENDNDY